MYYIFVPVQSHFGGPSKGLSFTADAKYQSVLRVLRGEDAQHVASELNISIKRLERWQRRFLDGARLHLEVTDNNKGNDNFFLSLFQGNSQKQKQGIGWGTLLLVLVVTVYFFVRIMGGRGSE